MPKRGTQPPEIWDMYAILGDELSQRLFIRLVKIGIGEYKDVPAQRGLTKKQYSIRLQRFRAFGLLKKQTGVYTATALGKVIYDNLVFMRHVMQNWTELHMLDAIDDAAPAMPVADRDKIWRKLLDPELQRRLGL